MTNGKQELTDLELGEATAGTSLGDLRRYISNSKGQRIGIVEANGIRYRPCPNCGKPTHSGWFGWYCDPCNKRFDESSYVPWNGTEEELKAASL